ncbi:hypothetical protein VNO77_01805 [Canavalia gladiata]|uniref:Uncharacterized protein n=1 Tax=Canavalia gladiata TaxID=3824 RepID=A0AAN9R2G2_CANGL
MCRTKLAACSAVTVLVVPLSGRVKDDYMVDSRIATTMRRALPVLQDKGRWFMMTFKNNSRGSEGISLAFKGSSPAKVEVATRLVSETSFDTYPDNWSTDITSQWPDGIQERALSKILVQRSWSNRLRLRVTLAKVATYQLVMLDYMESFGPRQIVNGLSSVNHMFNQVWEWSRDTEDTKARIHIDAMGQPSSRSDQGDAISEETSEDDGLFRGSKHSETNGSAGEIEVEGGLSNSEENGFVRSGGGGTLLNTNPWAPEADSGSKNSDLGKGGEQIRVGGMRCGEDVPAPHVHILHACGGDCTGLDGHRKAEVLVCKGYKGAYTAHLAWLPGALCAEELQDLVAEVVETAGEDMLDMDGFLVDLTGLDAASSLNTAKVFKICPAPNVSLGTAMMDLIGQIGTGNVMNPEIVTEFEAGLRTQILRAYVGVKSYKGKCTLSFYRVKTYIQYYTGRLSLRNPSIMPNWYNNYLRSDMVEVPSAQIHCFLAWEGMGKMPEVSSYDPGCWKDSGLGADSI